MIKYDNYNREERAACAHLFRLLHEKLENKTKSPLGLLLQRLSTKKLAYATPHFDLTELNFDNVGIFFEVAILRDAYNRRKDDMHPFMAALTRVIMQQENVTACTLFSKLPAVLNDPKETHPRQIKQKAAEQGVRFTPAEMKVYGAMQGMFNAKPDLAITVDGMLLVVEAKFTENFD